MTEREYKLSLEVNGREITTRINGETANRAVDKRPFTEELYCTASRDDDNIYIKAVNVRESAVTAEIAVEGVTTVSAGISELAGCAPDDMNDFDDPKKVYPKSKTLTSPSNAFEYTFPPQSVTVFKIKR